MTDYSKMSDLEINSTVEKSIGGEIIFDEYGVPYRLEECSMSAYSGRDFDEVEFDPCNNPADAWPIITENNISLIFDNPSSVMATSNCVGWYSDEEPPIHSSSNNPLRAAMIVFLMMKETEK